MMSFCVLVPVEWLYTICLTTHMYGGIKKEKKKHIEMTK